ncbi:MAG: hypothetical protein GX620_16470 [Chloroflexi bacterium]|nr:hypothetical protein [Chloroflexota bacterium]
MRYLTHISNDGPLSFRTGRDSATSSTWSYIPGTALLGGLAAAHVSLRNDPGEFSRFFLTGDARFGNLYPACFDHQGLQNDNEPVAPLPRTALTCKRFGGFQSDQTDPNEPHHGVTDSLIGWTIYSLCSRTEPLDALKCCPVCGEPLDRLDGFYRTAASATGVVGLAKVSKALRTRTGIDPATGAVKQGILYSREVLRSQSLFWGQLSVSVNGNTPGAFASFVQEANGARALRLGNNRTRGFGSVNLSLNPALAGDSPDLVGKRIEAFTSGVRNAAQAIGAQLPHAAYVPLSLTSDAILVDRLLRYQTGVTSDYLAGVWGLQNAQIVYENRSTRHVMGWNDLWRLPKPNDIAITMGSVFVLGLPQAPDASALGSLLSIQEQGIGTRRREGFGQVRVADPFHWEVKGA